MNSSKDQGRGRPWDLTGKISFVKQKSGRQGRAGYCVGTISTKAGDFTWVLKGVDMKPPKLNAFVTLSGVMEDYKGTKQLQVQSFALGSEGVNSKLVNNRVLPVTQRPADLIRYYRACIERERDGNTRVNSIEFLPRFMITGSPLFDSLATSEVFTTGVNKTHDVWFAKQLLREAGASLRVGYPTIKFSGVVGSNGFVAPLSFIEVEVSLQDGDYLLSRSSERLYWNLAGLEALGISEDIRDAVLLKLNEISDDYSNDKDRLDKGMEYLLQITGFDLRRDVGRTNPVVKIDQTHDILNSEVVYEGSDNKMSDSLIADLGGMIGAEDELFSGPLAVYLGIKEQAATPDVSLDLVTVLPSSPDQIDAISMALSSEVSCVTGPPGTGKSQFVANLASVALANGMSVLIASKNNQAVDVAISRLSFATPAGWPIRTGSRLKKEDASRLLTGAISLKRKPQTSNVADSVEMANWSNIINEIDALEVSRGKLPEIRSSLGKMRGELNSIEEGDISLIRDPAELCLISEIYDIISTHDAIFRSQFPLFFAKRRLVERQLALKGKLNDLPPASKVIEAYVKEILDLVNQYSFDNKRVLSGMCEQLRVLIEASKRFIDLRAEISVSELLVKDVGSDQEVAERLRTLDDEVAVAGRALVNFIWEAKLHAGTLIKLGLLSKAFMASNSKVLKSQVGSSLMVAPIWATTNLSAFPNFPLVQGLFDLVIIDEASQNDVASILPLLFRAKKAILVGDPHQLTHITSLSRSEANELAKKYNIEDESEVGFDYKDVSAYERGLLVSDYPVLLSEHYRSHPAIAEFANKFVYAGKLDICTDPRKYRKGDGLFWHNVEGACRKKDGRSLYNHEEAVACVNKISEITLLDPTASIGVVSPFKAQAHYIEDLLVKKFGSEKISSMNIRVATAHKFQGDERDYILLSTVVSAGSDEFSLKFANTPNLVNVAVTRSRRQLHVIGNAQVCQAAGGLLGKLANYAESLSRQSFESPAEQTLFFDLSKAGLSVETQVAIGEHRADMVVTVPGTGVKLVVECDGHPFHKDVVRDELRDVSIVQAGYSILHIPARVALGYGDSALEMVQDRLGKLQ